MTLFILRNEVDQVLKRIAKQKQAEVGGTFEENYNETKSDYAHGVITDGFIDFVLRNPDAEIVLGFKDKS